MIKNILIVEDNEILSNNIKKYLEINNISAKQLFFGNAVILELVSSSFDAIILDIGLPDISGLELCEKIREKGINIPILILTARVETKDKIEGLNSGADDYLTKPFEYDELIARLNALIRRNSSIQSKNIKMYNLEISLENKSILMDGNEVELSHKEFELLLYLVQNKDKIISKNQLLIKVWGDYDDFSNSRKVDVYIGYLRKKLGKDLIQTRRGEGYIIK